MTALRWGIFTSGVRGGTNILNSVTQDNSFSVTQCNKQGIIFHSFHLSHLTRAKEPLIAQKTLKVIAPSTAKKRQFSWEKIK